MVFEGETVVTKRSYGWKQSKPDPRDHKLKTINPAVYNSLPASVDLRQYVPEVLDQGDLQSCTANSISMAIRVARAIQKLPDLQPSRLFIYYNERLLEGTVDQDAGAELRDGAKVVATYGAPAESVWAYVDNNLYVEPSKEAYESAVQDEVNKYLAVDQTLNELKLCLHEGFPFVFGAMLYSAFESDDVAKTGIVPMPDPNDQLIGGHALCCVGYDDSRKVFIVLNSWSDTWGDHGYCYFPYDYMTNPNLCLDFWTIRNIAPTDPNRQWVIPNVNAQA